MEDKNKKAYDGIEGSNSGPSKQLDSNVDADFDEALRLLSFEVASSSDDEKTDDFDDFLQNAKSEIGRTAQNIQSEEQADSKNNQSDDETDEFSEILNSLPESKRSLDIPAAEESASDEEAETTENAGAPAKYLDELTPITDAPGVIVKDNRTIRKERTIFFTFVILTILMLAFLVVYTVLGQGDSYGIGIDVDPNAASKQVFEAPMVFASLKPNKKESVTFPEGIQEKYKQLYAANQHFVGWLKIPGTPVDTAIYQAHNNSYYLKRDLAGNYSKYGIPFLDYTNSLDKLSRNTVIYGHNFEVQYQNDLGFGGIEQYKNVEFYKKNPVIEFNTLYKDYKWKVFACFLSNGDPSGDNGYLFNYIATSMGNNSFLEFIGEVMQRSFIQTSVDIVETDKILTISTCSYEFDKGGRLEDLRCVVMARLVREGESEQVDTSTATQRTNVRYPQLYYNVFGGNNPYKNASRWYPSND